MEDRDIIVLYLCRDERAVSETSDKYGRLCHNISRRILGDDEAAEECVNDTYLGVWQSIPPEHPTSLCAYVAAVARNVAIRRLKYRRAAKRDSEALVSLEELESIIPDTASADGMEDREIGRLISEFLYSAKEEHRLIFVRKYWYFDSIEVLARKFCHTESKIKSILFRTRRRLKEYLTEKGVAL